ncbi:hypothetical protein JHK85_028324 [Glycine max]|nr:hypothetical protein JHK85_028324 [Glycine max]
MNFTRNIRCLRCDSFFEERINQLKEDNNHLPLKKGDWICNKCIYINFRRNMVFLKCDHRRLIVSKASSSSLQPQPEDIDHDKNSKFAFVAH